MQNIDPLEFANMLATELWCQQLANLEGLQSGVPTRTTATITPTQLRNFEQTYIELSNCRSEQSNHAGFVPPSVTQTNNYGILNPVGYCDSGPTTLHVSPGPLSASGDSSSSPGLPAPKRRNMGGRRPTKAPQDISPEEEERRKIRRERNKMAAARCRKRRLDHTNELQEETDRLEEKNQAFKDEIRKLNADVDQLQAILRNHLPLCGLEKRSTSPPDVKPFQDPYEYPEMPEDGVRVKVEVMDPVVDPVLGLDNDIFASPTPDKRIMLSAANPAVVTSASSLDTPPVRPSRPNFLQVPLTVTPAQIHNNKALGNNNKIAGIEISTPSNGIPFNFDSLMEGGTGLTPVHPHPHPHPHHPAHSRAGSQSMPRANSRYARKNSQGGQSAIYSTAPEYDDPATCAEEDQYRARYSRPMYACGPEYDEPACCAPEDEQYTGAYGTPYSDHYGSRPSIGTRKCGSPEPPPPPPRNANTENNCSSSFNESKDSNEISEAECDQPRNYPEDVRAHTAKDGLHSDEMRKLIDRPESNTPIPQQAVHGRGGLTAYDTVAV